MNVSGMANTASLYSPQKADPVRELARVTDNSAARAVSSASAEGAAAVYVPGKVSSVDALSKAYESDIRSVSAIKEKARRRKEELNALIVKTLIKQGRTCLQAAELDQLLREGGTKADLASAAKAREEIGEDGYWGLGQTAERLFSFVQALAGGGPAEGEEMKAAFIRGYTAAEKTWGRELPALCQQTGRALIQRLDDWISQGETKA